MKTCNNTSVGIILKKDSSIFLIKRKNFPYGFACPAGHLEEGESYEEGAKRELKEEVGLDILNLKLAIEKLKDNPCRRGELFHNWKVFYSEAEGEAVMQESEVSDGDFYDIEFINYLMLRTESYINQEISEEEWYKNPGMEIVWYDFFKDLKL